VDRDEELRLLKAYGAVLRGESPPTDALTRAVDTLFAAQHDCVYRACLRVVGEPQAAAEYTQEAFAVALQRLPSFRGASRFSTWLIGIARNLCFNALRRRRELLTGDGVVEAESQVAQALVVLAASEREEVLRRASAGLLPVEQEAIYLRYVEHLPRGVIAEVLSLPSTDAARVLLQRCLRKLRRGLRAELDRLGHGSSFFRERS
jgi:RNA polymerase sigma-70 factor (ECF subfamily)